MSGFGYNILGFGGSVAPVVIPPDVEDVFAIHPYHGTNDAGDDIPVRVGSGTSFIPLMPDIETDGGASWLFSDAADGDNLLYAPSLNNGAYHADSDRLGMLKLNDHEAIDLNDDGFKLQSNRVGFTLTNSTDPWWKTSSKYMTYHFKNTAKFFQIVHYTGNGSNQAIAHDLETAPGSIWIKDHRGGSNNEQWYIYHRSMTNHTGASSENTAYTTDDRATRTNADCFNNTAPTATHFTVGSHAQINSNTEKYTALLFAHNDDDGGFGSDGDLDIIDCGFWQGNGSDGARVIDMGFEPQWLCFFRVESSGTDGDTLGSGSDAGGIVVMDKFTSHNYETKFRTVNIARAEQTRNGGAEPYIEFNSKGIKIKSAGEGNVNNAEYLYIAIRKGTAVPTDPATVFYSASSNNDWTALNVPFYPDMTLNRRNESGVMEQCFRMMGKSSETGEQGGVDLSESNHRNPDGNNLGLSDWSSPQGFFKNNWFSHDSDGVPDLVFNHFKQGRKMLDLGMYRQIGTSGTEFTFKHSLGVTPEVLILKNLPEAEHWYAQDANVTGFDLGSYIQWFHTEDAEETHAGNNNETYIKSVSATEFVIYRKDAGAQDRLSHPDYNFFYQAWATLPGISKVGKYTGDGNASQNIDCGFANGVAYLQIKNMTAASPYMIWDQASPIVAGDDGGFNASTTSEGDIKASAAGSLTVDIMDPLSSGFTVTNVAFDTSNASAANMNTQSSEYFFIAIAAPA